MPVYIIRAGTFGPVKIGYADSVGGRLTKMQADNHERLTVLRILEGGPTEETILHNRFRPLWLHGEWFSFSQDMLGDLGMLCLAAVVAPEPAKERAAVVAAQAMASGSVDPSFGARLRQARRAAGLSQEALSEILGVRGPTISRYESHGVTPNYQRIPALVAALRVTADWLLGIPDAPRTPTSAEPQAAA